MVPLCDAKFMPSPPIVQMTTISLMALQDVSLYSSCVEDLWGPSSFALVTLPAGVGKVMRAQPGSSTVTMQAGHRGLTQDP